MQTDTSVINLNTSLIIPNKYQPRKIFDDTSLNNLAESIKTYGIINPILVRKKDDKYEIIAGERRFRAAQNLGLNEVPVIIKNANEQQMAELALIENIQRQGLTPIEEAKSYEEIMRIGNQTQAMLAQKLGKSQSSIANKIRLLSLPQEIQDALHNKKISERHARSLISVEDKEKQLELLNRIIKEKLTVKETEDIINSKDVDEEEIKQAISDIMKSLNIKEDEKEDDNMNNGNFFPNFDNNNAANNNASLNTMNMQSMNQAPMTMGQEPPMPAMNPMMGTTPADVNLGVPTPQPAMTTFEQFSAPMQPETPNFNMNPIPNFGLPQDNMAPPAMNTMIQQEPPLPTFEQFSAPMQPEPPVVQEPQMSVPMVDEPLFNPNITMPTPEPIISNNIMPEFTTPSEPTPYEIPVENNQSTVGNNLTDLQNYLSSNGYTYKTYSNDENDCIIIEMPRN